MRILVVALVVGCAVPDEPVVEHAPVCSGDGVRCLSHVATSDGAVRTFAAPAGLTPPDLQAAYAIDPARGDGMTVAIIDAYGYPQLESDLAAYRAQFGLPPCTSASGCLRVLNEGGEPSPLPEEPPPGDDWTIETALDMDMVSAGCPRCKIVVVQTSSAGLGLFVGQAVAVAAGATTISDSWGGPEIMGRSGDGDFDTPGIATFVSSGDNGFNPTPAFPSTSSHVFAVGGTSLVASATDPRGWTETAWGGAGVSCSGLIAKPSFQPTTTGCDMRATADISAVADPSTGVAVYNTHAAGGWTSVGGTSAAAPLVAAIFAGAGHGDASPALAYKHPEILHDVTMGQPPSCGTQCLVHTGWDGPTGMGTPDQSKLAQLGGGAGPTIAITYPSDGQTVAPGFVVDVDAGPTAGYVELIVDGVSAGKLDVAPLEFTTSIHLAEGSHSLMVVAYTPEHDSTSASIQVSVAPATMDGPKDDGICNAGGGSGLALVGLALVARPRRRRRRPT